MPMMQIQTSAEKGLNMLREAVVLSGFLYRICRPVVMMGLVKSMAWDLTYVTVREAAARSALCRVGVKVNVKVYDVLR
jgi:hypothetical protein